MQLLIDAARNSARRDVVATMIAHETDARALPPIRRGGYAAAACWRAGEVLQDRHTSPAIKSHEMQY